MKFLRSVKAFAIPSILGCFLILINGPSDADAQSTVKPLEYNLREELPVGSFVGNVKQDANLTLKYAGEEAHTKLRFHFRHAGQAYRYFSIDERKGTIHMGQVLDREELCPYSSICNLTLDVAIKPVQYFQIIKVHINLVDVNDNTPTFPQDRITLSIPETTLPGALFLIPSANDPDSGVLGIQEYQLLSDYEEFQLVVTDQVDDSKDVRLRLAGRLDREKEDRYSVMVLALDGGRPQQKTGSVLVEIIVLDANDNSPQFTNSSYDVDIVENLPLSTTLLQVSATDPDLGINGEVVYSFADYTERSFGNVFAIDDKTGDIYLKGSIDYEQAQSYQLTVMASDMGSGSLPVFVKVTVNVRDLNDNAPTISVNVLTDSDVARVQENADPGTFVAHAAVKDADSGMNKETECWLDNPALFRLEALYDSEYKITTAVSFDRELKSDHELTLTCRDKGEPSLTSSRQIDVQILDENDHSPQIQKALYEINVVENNPPNSMVLKINATDRDAGRNAALVYQIQPTSGTPDGVLAIDPILGKITSRIIFDYEKTRDYSFIVTVSDRGEIPRSTSTVLVIHVQDANDESPRFDKSFYYLSVLENQPTGTAVGVVNATDLDLSSEFSRVFYRLQSTDGAFEIEPETGELRNVKRLDREEQSLYRFVVVAYNNGLPVMETRVNVTVYVDDDNDNTPVFTFPVKDVSDSVEISGQLAVGSLVTRLVATDADSGVNSELVFSISNGNVDGLFAINPSTGVITIGKDLREAGAPQNRQHRLVVAVRDSGAQPLMAVADLSILINNTAGTGGSAETSLLGGVSLFEGPNILILAAILVAAILVLVCIIIAVVCVRKHRRRRRMDSSKYVVTKVVGAYETGQTQHQSQCRSPSCGTKSSVLGGEFKKFGAGGSLLTMDNSSLRSDGGSHRVICDCGGDMPPGMMVSCRGGDDIDDIDADMTCPMGVMTSSWNQNQIGNRITPSPRPPSSDTNSVRCGDPSTGYRAPPAYHHHHHHHCSCSCGLVHSTRCQSPPTVCRHHHYSSRKRALYSPETIPMQTVVRQNRDHDVESVCSESTWTDSGRGPSEEDDHLRAQLEPFLTHNLAPANPNEQVCPML